MGLTPTSSWSPQLHARCHVHWCLNLQKTSPEVFPATKAFSPWKPDTVAVATLRDPEV